MLDTYNYPQSVIDGLYEEGDRDYLFLCDLFGYCEDTSPEPGIKNKVDLNTNQELENTLLLTTFLIGSGAFAGFHMPVYGKPDMTFKDPAAFEDFIRKSIADDIHYLERITSEDRYTVGLIKIQAGAKAPPMPSEIERILA